MPFRMYASDLPPTTVTVSDRVIHQMAEGLGFNWQAARSADIYPAADDEVRWQRIFDHADWLNIQFLRFGQSGDALCDEAGHFRPGHPSFDQLRRVNTWAEARGVHLVLDPFSIPRSHQFEPWPGARPAWGVADDGYELGVKDIDRYVSRFVVPYVKYVAEEMNCRAVTWFNHINEPLRGNICATPPGTDDHVHYVHTLAAIRQGLDEADLSHIGNMGPDSHSHMYWPLSHMREMGVDPDPYIQAYCMHQYHSHFDWDRPSTNIGTDAMSVSIEDQLALYRAYAHDRGKPYLVTEVGMFHYGYSRGDPAGIARHDNTLLESEFIVRGLAKGADCMLRWGWLDSGWWRLITTTDGSDAPLRDSYYGYGTLLRYINRQAKILATQVVDPGTPQTVHAVAVENTDATRTLLVINDHYTNCARVAITLPTTAGTVRKIVNDPVRKHTEVEQFTPNAGGLELEDALSPMSLTVYTTSPR